LRHGVPTGYDAASRGHRPSAPAPALLIALALRGFAHSAAAGDRSALLASFLATEFDKVGRVEEIPGALLAAIDPLLSGARLADPVRLDTATDTWKPNAGDRLLFAGRAAGGWFVYFEQPAAQPPWHLVVFATGADGRVAAQEHVVTIEQAFSMPALKNAIRAGRYTDVARAADDVRRNRAVAQRVFDEILNQGRCELFAELYARDFVKHVDLHDRTLPEEIEDARAMRAASSDLVMTIDGMIAEGDKVAVRYTGRGTHTGPFGDMAATGRRFAITGATIYRFTGGTVAEEWTFYNMLEILRQLAPETPAASRP